MLRRFFTSSNFEIYALYWKYYLFSVEHGRLHHDREAQLPLVDLLLALLAAGAVRLGVLRPERQVVGGHFAH